MTIDMNRTLPRPPGHHTLTPGFSVPQAGQVISFLQKAFGAEVVERYDGPNAQVFHAELRISDSVVMLGDAMPEHPAMPASISLYVDRGAAVDETYARALAAGATSVTAPQNQFYGYRSACVKDVGGNRWTICAVVEQLTKEDIAQRMQDLKP